MAETEIGERVAKIETRLDALADGFQDWRQEVRATLARLEHAVSSEGPLAQRLDRQSSRLGALERWRTGVVMSVSLLWASALAWLGFKK